MGDGISHAFGGTYFGGRRMSEEEKENQKRKFQETQDNIIKELKEERIYQDEKWGPEFDNINNINDWVSYMITYLGRATDIKEVENQRKFIKKATAIGLAALETFDRNGKFVRRRYD